RPLGEGFQVWRRGRHQELFVTSPRETFTQPDTAAMQRLISIILRRPSAARASKDARFQGSLPVACPPCVLRDGPSGLLSMMGVGSCKGLLRERSGVALHRLCPLPTHGRPQTTARRGTRRTIS